MICVLWFLSAEDEAALKKSEVVNWYLKEIESEIDSEIELMNKKAMIDKVIHRLVHCVRKSLFRVINEYFWMFEFKGMETTQSSLTKRFLSLSGLYSDWAHTVWIEGFCWVQWKRISGGGCYSCGQPQLHVWRLDHLLMLYIQFKSAYSFLDMGCWMWCENWSGSLCKLVNLSFYLHF